MFSKSMFTQSINNTTRIMSQPVGTPNCFQFPTYAFESLSAIESSYTSPLSNATYSNIPGSNISQYFSLFQYMEEYINSSSCSEINLLFQIAKEGLQGSLNAYNLNYINTSLKLQNAQLQTANNQILAGINTTNALSNVSGQFTLNKSFTIAPLFSYYIMVYGFPVQGVGFDQSKLNVLLQILAENGINPYD